MVHSPRRYPASCPGGGSKDLSPALASPSFLPGHLLPDAAVTPTSTGAEPRDEAAPSGDPPTSCREVGAWSPRDGEAGWGSPPHRESESARDLRAPETQGQEDPGLSSSVGGDGGLSPPGRDLLSFQRRTPQGSGPVLLAAYLPGGPLPQSERSAVEQRRPGRKQAGTPPPSASPGVEVTPGHLGGLGTLWKRPSSVSTAT